MRVQIWLLELEGASEGFTVISVWLVREIDGSREKEGVQPRLFERILLSVSSL